MEGGAERLRVYVRGHGAGDDGFWLDNQGNKRKHYCHDQKQIWSKRIMGKTPWLN